MKRGKVGGSDMKGENIGGGGGGDYETGGVGGVITGGFGAAVRVMVLM